MADPIVVTEILVKQADLKRFDEISELKKKNSEKRAELMAKPEFTALGDDDAKLTKEAVELEAKFVKAAQDAIKLDVEVEKVGEKSRRPNMKSVTEAGPRRLEVTFGTRESPSWKSVVEVIESKNCVYKNGDDKLHPLNSVLPMIIKGKTETSETTKVAVKIVGA